MSMTTVPRWPRSCDRVGNAVSSATTCGRQASATTGADKAVQSVVARRASGRRAFIAVSQIRCRTIPYERWEQGSAATLGVGQAAGKGCLRWPGASRYSGDATDLSVRNATYRSVALSSDPYGER